MKRLMMGILLLACLQAAGQDGDIVRAVRELTGATGEEEVDPDLVERLEKWKIHPIPVNGGRRDRLAGLLSPYQIAALESYRKEHGDVLSWAELACVDGFGVETVACLRPFLSLASSRLPGQTDTGKVRQQAVLRFASSRMGAKYAMEGDRFQAALAGRRKEGSGYALFRFRRSRVLVGNYQVRYGQGLALWSGFSMTSLSSLNAFSRRGSGLTAVASFSGSGSHQGVGWDGSFGPVQAGFFLDRNKGAGFHAGCLFRSGEVGATVFRDPATPGIQADGKWNWRGKDLFWELGWKNRAFGAIGGLFFPLGENGRCAWRMRVVPSRFSGKKYGEYGLDAGLEYKVWERWQASLTAEGCLLPIPLVDPQRFELRVTALCSVRLRPDWQWGMRAVHRFRTDGRSRTDFRSDLDFQHRIWFSRLRLNAVFSERYGLLGYGEVGVRGERGAAYFRGTLFLAEKWADRLYSYERDAPGNFSVPAYYGHGFALSLYGGWKVRWMGSRWRFYLRSEWKRTKEKPGTPGLRFQLMWEH